MSIVGTSAVARPLRTPIRPEVQPRPHLEIAPDRAQRRARPRVLPAIVAVAGVVAILLVQLLLSIVLASGAYEIQKLQISQRDLARDEQALAESLEVRSSTQNLIANAEALGMVASGNPVFLDATTGAVTGSATAAGGSLAAGDLVGNSLLDGSTLIDPAVIAAANAAEAVSSDRGASVIPDDAGSTMGRGAESGMLASPKTR
ncbi:MAG TPA: hypothetical protein VNT53_04750 [Pseudolysinimonas sp.]|nr:hypothetical protein [Pseudolysinimonas sp.]